jgi:hypothetical protein
MPISPEGRARLVASKKALWASGRYDHIDFGYGRAPEGANQIMWKAYCQHRKNADQRGIEWLLTFHDWCAIWLHSGKWSERGRGANKYVMARLGPDVGPYAVGNVQIQRGKHNVSDGNKGKPKSQEHRDAISRAMQGNTNCVGRTKT